MTISVKSTTSSLDFGVLLGSELDNTFGLPSWCPNWFGLTEKSAMGPLDYLLDGYRRSSSGEITPNRSNEPCFWAGHEPNSYYRASRELRLNFRIERTTFSTAAFFLCESDSVYSQRYGQKSLPLDSSQLNLPRPHWWTQVCKALMRYLDSNSNPARCLRYGKVWFYDKYRELSLESSQL